MLLPSTLPVCQRRKKMSDLVLDEQQSNVEDWNSLSFCPLLINAKEWCIMLDVCEQLCHQRSLFIIIFFICVFVFVLLKTRICVISWTSGHQRWWLLTINVYVYKKKPLKAQFTYEFLNLFLEGKNTRINVICP